MILLLEQRIEAIWSELNQLFYNNYECDKLEGKIINIIDWKLHAYFYAFPVQNTHINKS